MIATSIGWTFLGAGIVWVLLSWFIGHATEYYVPWYEMPPQTLIAVPILLIGAGFIWR